MKKVSLSLVCILCYSFCTAQTAKDFYDAALEFKEKKDYSNALIKIDAALKIDSVNIDFWEEKAMCLEKLKMFQEAFNAFSKAISISPEKSYLYNNRGRFLMSIHEFDYSILDYTKAISLAEKDTLKYSYMVNRGSAKATKRDFTGAYDDFITAYNFDSTDIATLTDLASVCDEVGKGDQTLKYLLMAIKVDPDFYPAYGNIGFKYQQMGDYKKAIEYFDKVLQFNPEEPLGFSNRSYNKYRLGDFKGAYTDIEKSIKLYPENPYAYRIRALIYIEENKIEKACEDLQKAIDLGFTTMYGDEVQDLQKTHCLKK